MTASVVIAPFLINFIISFSALCIGFFLDLLFGDPQNMPHSVRLIGVVITKSEGFFRRRAGSSPQALRGAGLFTVAFVLAFSFFVPLGILAFFGKISPWLRLAAESVFCWQILAVKSLKSESMKVYYEIMKGDLPSARRAVSMIVGRDTDELTDVGVIKAAVETVAENTSDGVVAPLIFMAIGGAPLGFFYKAVNTMDSMLGYKNEKYLHFGRCAALLDDAVNYIPARIAARLMLLAARLQGFDYNNAKKIYKRDKRCHESPNSAQTESVCAGALGVCLGGDAYYFGVLHKKPTIGDALRPICCDDIPAANRLMYATAMITFFVCAVLKLLAAFLLW
ncbi:MAG: adenosylcobinamide-phosphate synthase CbiB [Hydrogenoanaerobacterium sp.]